MAVKVLVKRKGGAGSGNWGHAGRPGLVGGSTSRGGGVRLDYPIAGDVVDGRTVREDVSNLSSIGATFYDWEILDDIREVRFADFPDIEPGEKPTFYSRSLRIRTEELAEAISESGEIEPLIVAIDDEGLWVLEGGHRFDALQLLGAESFPALMVIDRDKLPWDDEEPGRKALLRVKGESASSSGAPVEDIISYKFEGKTRERGREMANTASSGQARIRVKGGAGSGNWGHAGRPGMVGGSTSRSIAMSIATGRDWQMRQAIAKVRGKPKLEVAPRETDTEAEARYAKDRQARIRFGMDDISVTKTESGSDQLTHSQLDKVAGWMAKNPSAELLLQSGYVSRVVFADNPAFDAMRGISTAGKNIGGFYDVNKGLIAMRIKHLDTEWGERLFTHEVGHAVHYEAGPAFESNWASKYRNVQTFDRHTQYAMKNLREGFAESYTAWIKNDGIARPGSRYEATFEAVSSVVMGSPQY